MPAGTLVRVTTELSAKMKRSFWIVAQNDTAAAEAAVREQVSTDCLVEATPYPVSLRTLEKLGLAMGQSWSL